MLSRGYSTVVLAVGFFLCLVTRVAVTVASGPHGVGLYEKCYALFGLEHCFFTPGWSSSWIFAQEWCSSKKSTLAIVNDENVQRLLEMFISYVGLSSEIWIGGRQWLAVGDWQWTSGRKYRGFELRNDSVKADYRMSAAMVLDKEHRYFVARRPTDELSYICQYDESRCPASTDSYRYHGRCFVAYHDVPKSWYQARNLCLRDLGDLARFSDVPGIRRDWLPPGRPHWVGLRTSWWTWPSGDEVFFTYWNDDQPNDPNKNCLALSMVNPWRWVGMDCSAKANYICHSVSPLAATIPPTTNLTDVAADGLRTILPSKLPMDSGQATNNGTHLCYRSTFSGHVPCFEVGSLVTYFVCLNIFVVIGIVFFACKMRKQTIWCRQPVVGKWERKVRPLPDPPYLDGSRTWYDEDDSGHYTSLKVAFEDYDNKFSLVRLSQNRSYLDSESGARMLISK